MRALLQYQDAYQSLLALGYKPVTDTIKKDAYYHFIDATGCAVSGYFVGVALTGSFAVGDMAKGGRLVSVRPVLYKPMTASEVMS